MKVTNVDIRRNLALYQMNDLSWWRRLENVKKRCNRSWRNSVREIT
jgi:hypothetical protein